MSTRDRHESDLELFGHGTLNRRALLGRTVALGVAPLAVAALARPGAVAAQSAPTGELIVGLSSEPDTLLSGAIQSALGGNIMRFIANGLAKLGQPSMEPEPDLATSWQASEDGKTYTFTLHDGVLWQDGQPFSVDDVTFSYGLWAHPQWPGPIDPNLAVIAGASDYKDGKAQTIGGIEAVDASTVRFTLTGPTPSFLANAATWQLLPKHILQNVAPADAAKDPFAQKPIYTGPFMVEEWRQGEGITFRAFKDCFAGAPKLDAIIFSTVPDPATLVADLQTGGVNLAFVTPDQYETFKGDSSYQTTELAGVAGWFFSFDTTLPLFADPNVRKAISHAIDRKTVIDTLLLGKAEPNHSVASPLSWIYNPNIPTFDYDVDKAKTLLDGAGWVAGSNGVRSKNGQDFTFKLNVTARTQTWAEAIQPYLEAVGITYEINLLEFGTWIEQMTVGKYQAALNGWFNFIIDPRADLQAHFQSPRPTDQSGYKNDQVDALFQQAATALNRDEEKKLYDQIQMIAEGDAIYAYLWRPQDLLVLAGDFTLPEVQTQSELYARAPEWSVK
jgi:peptide/nickel transport system substrate-binding protein